MSALVQIGKNKQAGEPAGPKPPWLRVRLNHSDAFKEVGALLDGLNLHTVCQEARCPNIWECWGQHRTATFMILGDVCTRNCRYCSVTSGRPPQPPDPNEPENVARAVARLGLRHTVITSVDRDDLLDLGAEQFVATVAAIRRHAPQCRIELLVPDFLGDMTAFTKVLDARPEVMDHNTETVPRLYRTMRPKGSYQRALDLLQATHAYRQQHGIAMTSKTGLMLGLGESEAEILAVMADLRAVHCDVLTMGQYLQPTPKHAPVAHYYPPEVFARLQEKALALGFAHVVSGPLVRSSYHAHEHVPSSQQSSAVQGG